MGKGEVDRFRVDRQGGRDRTETRPAQGDLVDELVLDQEVDAQGPVVGVGNLKQLGLDQHFVGRYVQGADQVFNVPGLGGAAGVDDDRVGAQVGGYVLQPERVADDLGDCPGLRVMEVEDLFFLQGQAAGGFLEFGRGHDHDDVVPFQVVEPVGFHDQIQDLAQGDVLDVHGHGAGDARREDDVDAGQLVDLAEGLLQVKISHIDGNRGVADLSQQAGGRGGGLGEGRIEFLDGQLAVTDHLQELVPFEGQPPFAEIEGGIDQLFLGDERLVFEPFEIGGNVQDYGFSLGGQVQPFLLVVDEEFLESGLTGSRVGKDNRQVLFALDPVGGQALVDLNVKRLVPGGDRRHLGEEGKGLGVIAGPVS
ncbi:MAG: hypothetical protein BWY73_01137 [candidate division TA06 bacterium ADurb.Bin417]|uniref:Uncharacterized protein n=1 Tax=candidate division TA06 bacterium ADurb.Bin417 TaxID=1852828 RepID=A0A1V5MDG5_UNCT6|nr:MAG: hypothetical protein BWY73_01137 [candidate division TA06 bacterium ADurb.Bin417]